MPMSSYGKLVVDLFNIELHNFWVLDMGYIIVFWMLCIHTLCDTLKKAISCDALHIDFTLITSIYAYDCKLTSLDPCHPGSLHSCIWIVGLSCYLYFSFLDIGDKWWQREVDVDRLRPFAQLVTYLNTNHCGGTTLNLIFSVWLYLVLLPPYFSQH